MTALERIVVRLALRRNRPCDFFLALALTAFGASLQQLFIDHLLLHSLLPFVPMVLISAAVGGIFPGLLTAGTSLVVACLVALAPPWSFAMPNDPQIGMLAWFALTSTIIVLTVHYLRAALRGLDRERTKVALAMAEMNHRVKNSLQMVSSMLRLHAGTANETTQHALQDASSRVEAIARVHELLATADEIGEIRFDRYLQDLCQAMTRAWQAAGVAVTCRVECDAVSVPTGVAVSLALIVNELLTTMAKHAAPDGRGVAVVSCRRGVAGHLEIVVLDRGIGLPAAFDPLPGAGLGMRIAAALARQLGAELAVVPGGSGDFAMGLKVPYRN